MTKRGKWLAAGGLGLLSGGWFVAQMLLGRHALIVMRQDEIRWRQRMQLLHPEAALGPVMTVHPRFWLVPAVSSLLALLACFTIGAALVLGGRRLWALLLVAAAPLSYLLGRGDANSLGLGWVQPSGHMSAWLTVGAVVDATVVVSLTGLAMGLLPHRSPAMPLAPAVLRTVPIAIVAFGYWLIGNPLPDTHARFFITRALLLILAAAVIATAQLPLAARMLVLLVAPFADPTMVDGLIHDYATWGTYVNHVAVAVATSAYVVALPAMGRRLRRRSATDLAVAPAP